MEKRNIIVIGASAGGFEALRQLISSLPSDLDAAIFIVWHMAPEVKGILPRVLNAQKTILAAHAVDYEPIVFNRIYVAPPDQHLILEKGFVRTTRGPKENRFRPSVDTLFRSAAYIYGERVIGVILSGALDDGTSGLWTIKNRGGIAIIQDPNDAEVPSMPEHALKEVDIDYQIPVAQMGSLLVKLASEEVKNKKEPTMEENEKTSIEIRYALQDETMEKGMLKIGELSPYACPECHGVLSLIKEGDIIRYRCHTGHAYSADSLLASITGGIEDALWNTIRGVEESIILLNNLGDHFAEKGHTQLAAIYFKKANEAEARLNLLRQAVLSQEQLSKADIQRQADPPDKNE